MSILLFMPTGATPLGIFGANLVGWADSTFGVTNDGSGRAVGWTWRTGQQFAQATGANMPLITTLNGRQALSYDGSRGMSGTWAAHQNLTAATYYFCLRPANAGAPNAPHGVLWLNTLNWYIGGATGTVVTETLIHVRGTPSSSIIGTVEADYDWAANETHQLKLSFGAAGTSIGKNGGNSTVTTFSGTPGTDRSPAQSTSLSNTVEVGRTNGTGFVGIMPEFIIVNKQSSATEESAMLAYFGRKWGF